MSATHSRESWNVIVRLLEARTGALKAQLCQSSCVNRQTTLALSTSQQLLEALRELLVGAWSIYPQYAYVYIYMYMI